MVFQHISRDPDILGGKPCIKGTRISVQVLLEWLASGATREEVLADYPQISEAAFAEALLYAAQQAGGEIMVDIPIAA